MKKLLLILATFILLIGAIFCFNYFSLTKPVQSKLHVDNRNAGIKIGLHYKNYLQTKTLIYDLQNISEDKAPLDIFRALLQSASALTNKQFTTVELCFKGHPKFIIKGDYFNELGTEYQSQNAIYTMRTFPSHLYKLTGEAAYSEWEGGIFAVFKQQMDDFDDFIKRWIS